MAGWCWRPATVNHGHVIDRALLGQWLAGYEAAWRSPGTGSLPSLFADDATYLQSPYEQPVAGLEAIGRMWEREREGPDEVFTLATTILAVDDPTAVVRAEVTYGDPPGQEYRDLWVIRFAVDGRCTWFEEWPFWPERPYLAGDDKLGIVVLQVDDEDSGAEAHDKRLARRSDRQGRMVDGNHQPRCRIAGFPDTD